MPGEVRSQMHPRGRHRSSAPHPVPGPYRCGGWPRPGELRFQPL